MQRAIIVKEFSACFFISKTSPRKSHCLLSFVGNLLLLLQLESTQSSIRATLSSSSISFVIFSLCVGEERMNFQHGVEHTLKTAGVVKSEQRREKQLKSLKKKFFCIVLKKKKEVHIKFFFFSFSSFNFFFVCMWIYCLSEWSENVVVIKSGFSTSKQQLEFDLDVSAGYYYCLSGSCFLYYFIFFLLSDKRKHKYMLTMTI